MRESRSSGSVEGIMSNHDSYCDCTSVFSYVTRMAAATADCHVQGKTLACSLLVSDCRNPWNHDHMRIYQNDDSLAESKSG